MGSSNSGGAPFRISVIDQVALGVGAGAIAALPSVPCRVVTIRALAAAGQTVYVARAADQAAATTLVKTWPMVNGETLTFEVQNANQLALFADVAGARVAYIAGAFY
jgi:hypothetical protein